MTKDTTVPMTEYHRRGVKIIELTEFGGAHLCRAEKAEEERDALREELGKAHLFAVMVIAFLGRDRGTNRQEITLDQLTTMARETDERIRAVLNPEAKR